MEQCGRCHETEAETFFDTYHGKVSRLGESGAAKCYDCHGTHDILRPREPGSTLSRDHVVETCGKCHEGSHRRFAGYLTHATHHDAEKYPWLFWSFWLMTALLVGTLTFALLHTLAWLVRLWLSRDQWRRSQQFGGSPGRANPLLGDFTLDYWSPCSAEHSPCDELIGAFDVVCGTSSVEEVRWEQRSWSGLKSLY